MDKPKSGKGVMVLLAIVAFLAIAYFASTWGGIAIVGVAVTLVAYLLWAGGVRLNNWILGS